MSGQLQRHTTNMFETAKRAFTAPFHYCPEGQKIFDARGEQVIDVRGWGRLHGLGALALPIREAENIQDQFGADVAALLTANWPK